MNDWHAVVALYCDGGVVRSNPSPIGGTWAWCGVNADGERVLAHSGFVPSTPGAPITNNQSEFIAALEALEAVPDGWFGTLWSDSMNTLGRLFQGWSLGNVPIPLVERGERVLHKLDGLTRGVLLQGHPSKAELQSGWGTKRGLPVSAHNVACDLECTRRATYALHRGPPYRTHRADWTDPDNVVISEAGSTDSPLVIPAFYT